MTIAEDLAKALQVGDFDQPIASVPYAAFLGLRLRNDGGALSLAMPYQEALIGAPHPPRLHGGVIGALLEFAGAVEVMAVQARAGTTPPGLAKPIGITIDYLRGGGPRDTYAAAEVQRLGRRVVNVLSVAWQEDRARPIASAHMHFLIAD